MTTLRLERPPVPDAVLTTVTAVLLAIGLLMVTSASVTLADRQHGDPFFYLERQLLAVALGLGAGYLMVRVPTALWQRLGFALALAAIVLLVLVLIPGLGQTVNGSTRWLRLGGVVVQVSEPARLMLLMYVADYAVRRNEELRRSLPCCCSCSRTSARRCCCSPSPAACCWWPVRGWRSWGPAWWWRLPPWACWPGSRPTG
jgi:cell division protein FtsW (lipid II flippase)